MRRAYVGMGANLGDAAATLRAAVAELETLGDVAAVSALYESDPLGYEDQPAFVNAAVALDVVLEPDALLDGLLDLERRFGRVRGARWGPRTLDLDLLWYQGVSRDDQRLTLPHPRAAEREFVLRPLADVAPDLELSGRRVDELLRRLPPQGVRRLGALME